MHARTLLAGSWLALHAMACDPTAIQAQPQPSEAKAKSDPRDFAVCMAGCAKGQHLDANDRATCRLTCEEAGHPVADAGEASAAKAILMRFDACDEACGAEQSATDRATCRLQCAQTAARTGAAGDPTESVHTDCNRACLEGLVDCETACPTEPDDRATCGLHCETGVTRCLDRCDAGPAA